MEVLLTYCGLMLHSLQICFRSSRSSIQPKLTIQHRLMLLRFIQKMAEQPFRHGGYWLVKLELCSSIWIKLSRPRTAAAVAIGA